MTTSRCPSDILITSWLFTAWWSMWPGNHLVPCVAELVRSCIPIHEHRCLPDPKCLFYPSGLSLCLSVDHFCLVPVNDIHNMNNITFSSMAWCVMADLWGSGLCTRSERVHCFLVFLDPQTKLPACLSLPWRLGSVYQEWKSPLLSCVPWSSDQTSCQSLQNMSWSSSCKGHDRSIWSSLHPWPCPSDEPKFQGPGDFQVTCSIEL